MPISSDARMGLLVVGLFISFLFILLLFLLYRRRNRAAHFEQQQRMFAESELLQERQQRAIAQTIVQHTIEKEEQQREVNRRRRVTPTMKASVLARDNYTCQICGISRDFFNRIHPMLGDYLLLEIDHKVSVFNGGVGQDDENLQVLCWRCNRKKGKNKTNEDVLEAIDYGLKYIDSDAYNAWMQSKQGAVDEPNACHKLIVSVPSKICPNCDTHLQMTGEDDYMRYACPNCGRRYKSRKSA